MKTILLTGSAGFIGAYLVLDLLSSSEPAHIIGIDNLNDYYDVAIKEYRLHQMESLAVEHPEHKWTFIKGSIADKCLIDSIFTEYKPSVVVNLAAQAGVCYSITNPDAYIEANLIGFYNIPEACRNNPVKHLVYASSSSVYGTNKKVPYSTEDKVDNPVSLYAATKNSNKLRAGETIEIFNYGNCMRDFTYVADIVEGVKRVMAHPPEKSMGEDGLPVPPYKVYNIGNSAPENLLEFVNILQQELIVAKVLPEDYDYKKRGCGQIPGLNSNQSKFLSIVRRFIAPRGN